MPQMNFYLKLFVFSDVSTTLIPVQQDFDWVKQMTAIDLDSFDSATRQLAVNATTAIQLPSASIDFLYIEVDRLVYLRLNGDAGSTVRIEPSVAGVNDGVYFKTGTITSISINNPDLVNKVNCKICMGA